jgi:hypothetical protein
MGAIGEFLQFLHVLAREQLALIGPSFDAGRCTHPQEAPALLKDFKAVAVFNGGDSGGLQRDVGANFEDRGTDERLSE